MRHEYIILQVVMKMTLICNCLINVRCLTIAGQRLPGAFILSTVIQMLSLVIDPNVEKYLRINLKPAYLRLSTEAGFSVYLKVKDVIK